METLNDFIKLYDNAISDEVCDFLVNLFDQKKSKTEKILNDGKPNFTQLNLTKNRELSEKVNEVHNLLIKNTLDYKNKYYEFVYKEVFPGKHAFEQFRIKKYDVGGQDRFDTHVDVKDHESSRRYLSFMWYLNDVTSGGKTVFNDFEVIPKKGSLLVFPPLWMFPHKAEAPVSNPKYIITTYLHYQ